MNGNIGGALKPMSLKIRKDQREFLTNLKNTGVNINHWIRLAIDEKKDKEEKK